MSWPDPETRDRDAARRRLATLLAASQSSDPLSSDPLTSGPSSSERQPPAPRPLDASHPGRVGGAAGADVSPGTRSAGALDAAAAAYADAYGVLPGPEHVRPRTRWRVAPRTVAAAALAVALLAGGVALRAAVTTPGEPVELPVPGVAAGDGTALPGTQPGAAGATPGADAPSSGAQDGTAAPQLVVVDVTGAVRRPGVVTLPVGARVVDAVDAAGGARPGADLSRLNLARVLVDGEQVVVTTPDDPAPVAPDVPAVPDPGSGGGPGGGSGPLVDLNAADEATLDTLPGIGPVLAARIVEHRATQPFGSVDDLEDVPGIGPALMGELRSLVTV